MPSMRASGSKRHVRIPVTSRILTYARNRANELSGCCFSDLFKTAVRHTGCSCFSPEMRTMAGRVLVVDDEEAIVEGLLCLLRFEAIESNGAFDRVGAEVMIEGTFYSVIVADLRLHSEAEGLELLDAIRRISPRSRVLTLTGFATMELENEVLRRGSSKVMRKPAQADDILGAIADLLAEVEKMAAAQETLDLEQLHLGMRKVLHSIPRKRYGLTADEAEEVVQRAWL